MIIKINVVPEHKDEANPRELIPPLLAIMAMAGLAYYVPVFYADTIRNEAIKIQEKTTEKKNDLAKLQVDLNRAKGLQASLDDIKARQNVIKSLTNGRKQPVAILERLQDIHLDQMWISSLEAKNNLISTTGWATNYGIISEYVRRIKVTTGKEGESALDASEFTPVFQLNAAETPQQMGPPEGTTGPVIFSNVNLKNSIYQDAKDSVIRAPIQKFEIEFNVNMGGG